MPVPHGSSARSYLDAAYAALSSEGHRSLGLRALCSRMGVTTGGFYHWFPSWHAFVDALLDDWKTHRTTALRELAAAETDPVARLERMAATAQNLDRRTEAAIRLWGQAEPRVARAVGATDAERFAVVRDAMEALVGPVEAGRFARWGYSVLLGFEQLALAGQVERDDLTWSLGQVLAAAQNRAVNRQSSTSRPSSAVTSTRRSAS